MFGRRRTGRHARGRGRPGFTMPFTLDDQPTPRTRRSGPFDSADAPDDGVDRLDLGSVQVPLPAGAQLQVEVDQAGPVRAVHLVTELGQFTVNAFAAPRSGDLWNEVRRELVAQLTATGARVSEEAGEWGREVVAVRPDAMLRFIGVNGPRWLLRGVVAGAAEHAVMLANRLRDVLRGTVVVRGPEPMPPRAALPITLPAPMAEQLEQAAAARVAQLRQDGPATW